MMGHGDAKFFVHDCRKLRRRPGFWLVGTVLVGTVLIGTVLFGTVLFGTVLFGTVLIGAGSVRAEEAIERHMFTTSQRQWIDDNALWGPREKQNIVAVEATGSAIEWLVARTPLPVAEEIERAAKLHADVLRKNQTADLPPHVADVLAVLVDSLPPRMRATEYDFSITVVDQAKVVAFAAGAGRIYVSRQFLDSCPAEDLAGRDRIALVLAHELGHLCLGHARRLFQRQWLYEHLKRDFDATPERFSEAEANQYLDSMRGIGAILEYSYSREDDFLADLFACHLCRNAGFDIENGLDVLRSDAVAKNSSLMLEPPVREGVPPIEPEIQEAVTGEAFTLAPFPTSAHRLRRIRLELDGLIYGDEYGLFEFDKESKELRMTQANSVQAGERVVVCIHGMESSLGVYRSLMEHLAELDSGVELRILGFQYPADESLARSAKFFARQMRRCGASSAHVDFVCHSAGGLVLRHYVEVDGGDFHRVYFQGTPHLGSNLAALRSLLEVGQFIGDLNFGYDAALASAIRDGHGQISHDLLPESLFLSYLNRPTWPRDQKRYTIYRGTAFSRTRSLIVRAAWLSTLNTLSRRLEENGKDDINAEFARAAIKALVLPDEIFEGDLCVTPSSAQLAGVEQVIDYRLNHTQLPRDRSVIEHLARQLVSEDR